MRLRLPILGATVALAVGFSATAAFADGYRPRAGYAVPTAMSWTGFYVGVHAGGAWSEVDWSNVSFAPGERFNNSESGFIGGAQIGYNHQLGNIVLGVEATVSGTDLSRDFRSILVPARQFSADVHSIATVTGRFGVASDQWLFYGKAGWASARVAFSGRDTVLVDSFSFDDWRNGWTAGIGLEYKINRNMSFGVEYAVIELGSETDNGLTRLAIPVTLRDHDREIQSVTARLNFQFHRDEYRAPPLK